MPSPVETEGRVDRRRLAGLAVLPFLLLGVGNVLLLLGWGLRPLWAFLVLPPVVFMCVLAWIAFKSGFA